MTTARSSAPTAAELAGLARAKVLFGHKSVGSNILSGIGSWYQAIGIDPPRIVETRQVPDPPGPFLAHTQVGVNRDPLGKLADFAEIMDGPLGDAVDVALVKFCYADVVSSTDVAALFARYAETMADLATRRPTVRLVHTTVPLTTDRSWKARLKALTGRDDQRGPADNLARQRYNTLVRDRYSSTGRLFDVAAVEATLETEPMVRGLGGEPYHVLNRSLSSDAGHLNAAGARVAAAEFVRVLAASAGSR